MASQKMLFIIKQIVRLRAANVKDVRIAAMLNLSNSGLQRILRTQEYQDEESAYFTGVLSKQDQALAGCISAQQQIARQAVPAAYQAMIDIVLQKRDVKARLVAAKEILDRDPDGIHLNAADRRRKEEENNDLTKGTGLPPSIFDQLKKESATIVNGVQAAQQPPIDKSKVN